MTYDLLIIAYMGMLVVNECDCTGLRWDVLSFAVLRWDVLSFAVLRWDVLSFAVLLTIYSANSWFCIYFYYIAIIDALFWDNIDSKCIYLQRISIPDAIHGHFGKEIASIIQNFHFLMHMIKRIFEMGIYYWQIT